MNQDLLEVDVSIVPKTHFKQKRQVHDVDFEPLKLSPLSPLKQLVRETLLQQNVESELVSSRSQRRSRVEQVAAKLPLKLPQVSRYEPER